MKQIEPDSDTQKTKLDNVFIGISLSDIYLNNIVHEGALEFDASLTSYRYDDETESVVF